MRRIFRRTRQEKHKTAEDQLLERLSAFGECEPTLQHLRELYLTDPELLFQLATIGVPENAPEWAKRLYNAANRLREIVYNATNLQTLHEK